MKFDHSAHWILKSVPSMSILCSSRKVGIHTWVHLWIFLCSRKSFPQASKKTISSILEKIGQMFALRIRWKKLTSVYFPLHHRPHRIRHFLARMPIQILGHAFATRIFDHPFSQIATTPHTICHSSNQISNSLYSINPGCWPRNVGHKKTEYVDEK